jgi:hypothetical protein
MLPTRTQRFASKQPAAPVATRQQQQRRHLTEGANQSRRVMTEETDLHKATVIHESKKNVLVRKMVGGPRQVS